MRLRFSGSISGGAALSLVRKLPGSYTIPVNKSIHLITLAESGVEPVGSFAYKLLYPGDIDIREEVTACCSRREAGIKIALGIQRAVQRIVDSPGFYFSELKAGLDLRFPDRDHQIVRWNAGEILSGFKVLPPTREDPNGVELHLSEAVLAPTITKIDMWAPVGERYVEVSNFLILFYKGPRGKVTPLTPVEDYIASIRHDVGAYLLSNTFKAIKRMLLLARSYEDDAMISRILPLVEGDEGLLYQIVSDMRTLVDMLDKLKGPSIPYKFFYREIDGFKGRLSNISSFDFREGLVDAQINAILGHKIKGKKLARSLEAIADSLLDVLNVAASSYGEKVGILPPPPEYM